MQTIYLDISNKGTYPCIHAKQGEVGRKFLAVITDAGVPYVIPSDGLVSVWYSGDMDEGNYSSIGGESAFSIEGNKIVVELIAQMLLKPGNGELCLSINIGGDFVATWNIPYSVEAVPGYGSSVPTEYYTALTEAGEQAAIHSGAAQAAATEAKAAAKNATNEVEANLSSYVTAAQQAAERAETSAQEADTFATDAQDFAQEASDAAATAARNEINSAYAKFIPVGYVFQWEPVSGSSVDLSTATNVASHFGFGTWEQIKDRFLLSVGDSHVIGEAGGSETHSLTIAEMPSHNHYVPNVKTTGSDTGGAFAESYGGGSGNRDIITGNTGNNLPFSTMPPYRTVYTWKRVA